MSLLLVLHISGLESVEVQLASCSTDVMTQSRGLSTVVVVVVVDGIFDIIITSKYI